MLKSGRAIIWCRRVPVRRPCWRAGKLDEARACWRSRAVKTTRKRAAGPGEAELLRDSKETRGFEVCRKVSSAFRFGDLLYDRAMVAENSANSMCWKRICVA